MSSQPSLFPTYLKELQAEGAKQKRLRVKELVQVDFLQSFEKEWIEGLAEVENILKYLQKHPTTINVFKGRQLIKPENLLNIQKDWISLCSKYTGMEQEFFKPYWVPIEPDSLDFFIDLSNKKLPVIESSFYFIEPMQYMKIVLLENGVDLMKHTINAKPWHVISYAEKSRQQQLIVAQKPALVYAGKIEVEPPNAYDIFHESEPEEGAEKGVFLRKKNEVKCTIVRTEIASLLPYDSAITIEEIKFKGPKYLIPDKVKCVRDLVYFLRTCTNGSGNKDNVKSYKVNFTNAGKSYMSFKNDVFILHHEDQTILDGFEKNYRAYYVEERNADQAIMNESN